MRDMSRKQGTISPCAACKLLRRRCAQECVFAPYFPADEPQKFANVHKVFGACNVNKMLQLLPAHHRSDAVSSMVYEANARVRDPVYGCVGAISFLQQQVAVLQTQLAQAQAEVVHMRMRQAASFSGLSGHSIESGSPSSKPSTPPKPWHVAPYWAFGFIFFLVMLQFLPPTHFVDPSADPLRIWIPFGSYLSSPTVGDLSSSNEGKSSVISTGDGQNGMIHVVSWMDCLDIRMLAVLVNSTLSSSRYPERIHFHIFTPKGDKDKVSYNKLKVLFPHSSLELIGQEEVIEKLKNAISVGEHACPSFHEVAPFLIPSTHPFLKRFIYVSPDIIMKGRIEELFGVNLSNYAVAAAEDCSRLLHEYVNFEVLDAIQRSVTKPWVSMKSYEKNACAPDLGVLLIDANKLEYDITEAILWWNKVLNKENDGTNQTNPAFVLAHYDKYLKLSTTWRVRDRVASETNHEVKLLRYDGARKTCSPEVDTEEKGIGSLWKQYLSTSSHHNLVS